MWSEVDGARPADPPRLQLVSKLLDGVVFYGAPQVLGANKAPKPRRRQTMNTTILDRCDIAAYRSWSSRRVTPAYMRGMPSWVWTSALCRRRLRQPAVT
jgi:hypothetical protein